MTISLFWLSNSTLLKSLPIVLVNWEPCATGEDFQVLPQLLLPHSHCYQQFPFAVINYLIR